MMMTAESEPINLDQYIIDSKCLAAMKEELMAIEKKKTWELVERSGKKPNDVK